MKIKLHFEIVKLGQTLKFGLVQRFFLGLLLMISCGMMGQVNITPTRSIVSGFPSWTDTNVAGGAGYLQLLVAGANTISPAMDFDAYTGETLDFRARTFGGSTVAEIVITVSISTNDGTSWTILGTRTPSSNVMAAQTQFNISAYSGSQVKIRFSVAGTNNAIGVGIEDINIKGYSSCTTPTISFPSSTISKNVGDANYTHLASSTSSGAITYSSSNTSVANVNASTGEVTLGTAGTATITATQVATSTHCAAVTTYSVTVNSTIPVITTTGTLTGFTTVYGSLAASQNFSFMASNLTGSTVTAVTPAGFEISTSAGGPFGSTATYTVSGGSASGIIYIRLVQTMNVGTYSGSISLVDDTNSATTTKTIPTSTITQKSLTITGISGTNKIYDASVTAVLTGTPSLTGILFSDDVSLSGTPVSTFANKNVGTAKPIATTGYTLSGTMAGNYIVNQPATSANITAKPLTIFGAIAQNKPYDGSNLAVIMGTLSGVIGADAVTLNGTGIFTSPNVAAGIAVSSTATLSGTDAGNYSLAQPSGLSANITAVAPTFTTSSININTGGTYGLPGPNISSNSTGVLSYTLATATPAGAVTVTGTTLNGIAVGTATLTITQVASGNYTGASTTVTVNVTTVSYVNGDYRTNPNAVNPIFFDSTTISAGVYPWQTWNGSSWIDVTGASAGFSPQGLVTKPENIYLNHSSVNVATGATYKNIIVEGGYVYSGNTSTGLTIEANKSLDIKAGYILIDGRVTFLAGSNLNVRSNAELEIGSTSFNFVRNVTSNFTIENNGHVYINKYLANVWTGNENFFPDSYISIYDWDNNANLFSFTSGIPSVTPTLYNGYTALFGFLRIETAIAGNWTVMPSSSASFNMTHGDFTVINNSPGSSSQNINLYTGNSNAMGVGRDFILQTPLASSIQYQTGAGTPTLNVKRDLIKNGNGSGEFRFFGGTSTKGILNIERDFLINDGIVALQGVSSSGSTYEVNLKGNLKGGINSILRNANTNSYSLSSFNFLGSTMQTVDVASIGTNENSHIYFYVKSGAYVQLINRNFDLGTNSKVTVENGGTLNFGFDGSTALNITGNGTTGTGFTSQTNSTLIITSSQGIANVSGSIGNIQTNTAPVITQAANFHYVGKVNQVTGTGLTPTTAERYVFVNLLDNTKELRLTNKMGITAPGKLEIQKGVLIGEGTSPSENDFYGTGNFTMTDGEYRISTIASNPSSDLLPQLSGTYTLSAGTVTLNGNNADQVLRHGKTYYNLKIAGTNALLSNAKKVISNTGVTVNNELYITENGIFDSQSHAINGNANVKMDLNSRWRNSRTSITQPELLGTYSLTNGTMEFYGTTASTSQTFKGGIGYNNIDINADAINSDYVPIDDFFNVSTASSITVSGILNVNSPAAFKIGSTYNIAGTGSIVVKPGATLLYGSENGIKTSGTGTLDGAIRVTGTRTFSSQASYGFIGGQATMVSGDAIPTVVENLYVARTNNLLDASISNSSLSINNKLVMLSGNIVTGANTLTLGVNVTNKGTLEHTSGFIKGKFSRWFNGNNSGNPSGLFPLGTIDNKNRFAKIEFTNPATGGTLTASVDATLMGSAGVSAIAAIPAVGSCSSFGVGNTEEFFWTIVPNGVSGNYTGFFTRESISTDPICETTLLKRDATNWEANGTHLEPTGTSNMVTVSRSGLTGFKDFGFGFKKCKSNIWNGSLWSEGTPNITHSIILNSDFTSSGTVSACECQISTGATMTILPGHTLELQYSLNNSGTLIIENEGSLVQHDNFAMNNGKIIMKRNTQPMYRYDFTYWSSPLTLTSTYKLADSNLTIPSLSPATLWDKYYFWNNTSQAWNTIPNGNEIMVPGKGYIVRAPQTYSTNPASTTIYSAIFEGFPGNGIVTAPISTTLNNYNLIGNPYPSAISADLFLSNALNTGVVDGTIYLWTHNSPPNTVAPGDNTYNYTSSDYASYNFTGGVATADNAGSEPDNLINTPSGFIAAGQSFFIKSTGGGNATFDNSMRSLTGNNQFFRSANVQTASQNLIEKHRIWLNVSNTQGAFNQTLVGYVANATNGFDRGYDGEVMGGNYVSIYSIAQDRTLVIQGRELPFQVLDKVDLGFKVTIAGDFKIAIDHLDGLFTNQNIYLEDKLLNVIHDLKQSAYNFTSLIGTFNSRFELRYTNETLGTGESVADDNDVIVYVKDKAIKAISVKENIESITVFDLLGRMIYNNKDVNSKNFSIDEITANQQALIVKLKLENGQKLGKKIIYN